MPRTCSHIEFLMLEHPLAPLFQHSGESVPQFLSVKVDQHLDIETFKISKHQRVPPLNMRKDFVSDFTQFLSVEPLNHKNFKFLKTSEKENKNQNIHVFLWFSIGN